jgi:hypothetical protein
MSVAINSSLLNNPCYKREEKGASEEPMGGARL